MGIACIDHHLRNWICAADIRVSVQLNLNGINLICTLFSLIESFFFLFDRNAQNAFYKVLLANAATSALRLHQRMPRLTLSREYFALLLVEDSCHYLFFSTIFLYVSPFILILLPVVLFAILHAASYSLTLLDVS